MSIALRDVIDFEAKRPRHTPQKEVLIRNTFGLSAARYYQRLNYILTTSVLLTEALEYNPLITRRLLDAMEARAAARTARKVTLE